MLTKKKDAKSEKQDKEKLDKSSNEKLIKFDFNPIEVRVTKYNLRFPVDGMF